MARTQPSRAGRKRRLPVAPTIHRETAYDFLDAISPRSGELRGSRWIFRGHGQESYELVPAALRPVGEFESRYFGGTRTMRKQVEGEFRALSDFFTLADHHGVLPPDISSHLRDILDSRHLTALFDDIDNGRNSWLPDSLLYLAAVAQHHGVPTRLLDWTQHPFIAAYFAAHEIVRDGRSDDTRLVVWAFNADLHLSEDLLADLFHRHHLEKGSPYRPVRLITVSAAGNPNLHAQRGIFTLFRPERISLRAKVDRRPLDALLPTAMPGMSRHSRVHADVWVMKRFTLPVCEAGRLMRLLADEGVTAARLFPGLGGIVTSMRESLRSQRFGVAPHA